MRSHHPIRRALAAVTILTVLAACGGGDDDGDDDAVALEEIEPIVDIDPCDLLDEDTASGFSGSEVASPEAEVEEDGTTSCSFAFTDETDADNAGSAIAASLSIGPGDEDDIPGGALARSLSMGDSAAVVAEEKAVRTVYIVEEVVVRVEVAPGSGEVTPELIEAVIEFTETTVAPVTEAVTGGPPEPETTTTATTEPEEEEEATPTTSDLTIDEMWGRSATEFRDQVGETFEFECEGPAPEGQNSVWGTGTYTDDSSVCWAAVHAGAITPAEGGTVVIEMRPGQDAFPASLANGVQTFEWPEWPGAFAVVGTA